MKEFTIRVPFAGYFEHVVKAETEEEAIEQVEGVISNQRFVADKGCEEIDVIEWDVYDQIVQGNVFYGPLNEREIESVELEDEDDE